MKILITGGSGFIGSYLAEYLLKNGHQVIIVDNLSTGRLANIRQIYRNENLEVHIDTIFNKKLMNSLVKSCEQIYHLAAAVGVRFIVDNPVQTIETNVAGTEIMIQLANQYKKKIFIASTSEVYGDPLVNPQKEDYWGNVNCIGPRGVYDESKRFAEAITMAYHRYHGVDTRIVRIFNTYGERMRVDDGRVVPNFICQALKGEPLTVYGSGKQTRSFCYISDLLDGMWKLMQVEYHEPINIGNPDEITILEFSELVHSILRINRVVGKGCEIVFEPLPVNAPKVRRPDITRARELLGWHPEVNLRNGLHRTIEYFRRNMADR